MLAKSGILEIFVRRIPNTGLSNQKSCFRNMESHLRLESVIRVPLTKIWNRIPGIHGVETTIQDFLGFPCMRLSVSKAHFGHCYWKCLCVFYLKILHITPLEPIVSNNYFWPINQPDSTRDVP